MNYLHWNEITITDFSEKNVADMYDRGYVFTRIGKGVMHQTRSCRIDLSKFELSSENRRILKKAGELELSPVALPSSKARATGQSTPISYDWRIGKLAKDFYETKFGSGIMSAQKVKELLTDTAASNFNLLLRYNLNVITTGYAICYDDPQILHYSYPFYDLKAASKDMGLGMMIKAIEYARSADKRYIYLGSLQRPGDTYKLQFAGLQWFDGGPDGTGTWRTDIEAVKRILADQPATNRP